MLDNNVNQNLNNPKFAALSQQQAQYASDQPAMQAVNPELLRNNVQDSYVSNRLKASEGTNPLAMAGTTAAVWYALSQAMDKFNPKCRGDYKDSALGKAGNWGDRFAENNFIGKKIEGFFKWVDNGLEKLSKKSKIVYSLRNHSTQPEWSFAKVPGKGPLGFLATDTEQIFEEFLNPISKHPGEKVAIIPVTRKYNAVQKLEQYGLAQSEIDTFRNRIKNLSFDKQALELQKKELECLGVNDRTIRALESKKGLEGLQKLAYNLKVKKLGFKSVAEYNAIKGKFIDHPKEVMAALKRAYEQDNKFFLSNWRTKSKVGNNLMGRIVHPQEYYNKFVAAMGLGNRTAIGRFLPKTMAWFLEGTTNRFAGGKLAVLMQAGIFADMLIHTFKAPKGEKGKTLAERFVNDFTYFFAMTAGIIGMHKIGGFKYLGLDKNAVKQYRAGLEKFNKDVKAGLYTGDKKAYKAAAKNIDKILKPDGLKLNIFQKGLRKLGKLINWGNERKASYRAGGKLNMNLLRKIANGNIVGVPLRILIPIGIVSPFLAKWATKTAHAIFGKPTRSVLDEDKEEEPQKPAQTPQQVQNQQQNLPQQNQPQQVNTAQQAYTQRPTNLINQYKQQTNQNTVQNTNSQTAPQKPSDEPVRTYIPSPMGVQIANNEDLTAAEAAMRRADLAEQQAYQTLKMN